MSFKIDRMHELFGVIYGEKCKDCMHLKGGKNEYRKCEIYGTSNSQATDFALSYTACGMFNKAWNGDIPVYKLRSEKQEEQIPGQISLEDL